MERGRTPISTAQKTLFQGGRGCQFKIQFYSSSGLFDAARETRFASCANAVAPVETGEFYEISLLKLAKRGLDIFFPEYCNRSPSLKRMRPLCRRELPCTLFSYCQHHGSLCRLLSHRCHSVYSCCYFLRAVMNSSPNGLSFSCSPRPTVRNYLSNIYMAKCISVKNYLSLCHIFVVAFRQKNKLN